MRQAVFDQIRLSNLEQNLGIYGIHLYRDSEELELRLRSDEPVNLYSASKTFASAAVGICADEEKFTLNDTALSFFPEYAGAASEGSEKITIRDLLHMSSGKEVFWFSVSERQETDWAKLFFQDPVHYPNGQRYFYSNACTYMLGRIVEKVTGQNVRDFLMPRLFGPLDIFNPQWNTCPNGHTVCGTGLHLTTRDLSKLGRLLLQEGVYNGKRILSKNYVNSLRLDLIETKDCYEDPENASGYGYQVWRCSYPGAYRLDGKYGQLSIIIPDHGAVVTVTAHNEKAPNDIIRAVFSDLVSQL